MSIASGVPDPGPGTAAGAGPGPDARPRGRRLPRRLVQLYVGLALYGVSSALLVRGGLGLEPWGVLHQGIAERTGLSIGVVSIIVGAVVLLLWIPIRQRPGLGTVSNVFVIGIAMDGTLALVPELDGLPAGITLMVLGILLNGLATGLYIAARFGPGPRDGLMTGLHRLTGRSIRLVRTLIEIAVVATGFALGGSVGVGTVLYALSIGPLAQFFLRLFAVPERETAGGGGGPGGASVGSNIPDLGTGSTVLDAGSNLRDSGSTVLDSGSNIRDIGSGSHASDPGSDVRDIGSDIRAPGSNVQDPGSSPVVSPTPEQAILRP